METDDGKKYFVKIFEDPTMKPTLMAKKLFIDKNLKNMLSEYLLLPAMKPIKAPHLKHKYEVVIYPYLSHITLEQITLKAWSQKYIDPSYFEDRNKKAVPHAPGYKKKMLQVFHRVITIAIQLKNAGYVDMDIRYIIFASYLSNFCVFCSTEDVL